MFRFSGTIDRKHFAIGIALRIGFFVAATVAFPFLMLPFAASFGCSPGTPSDGCGILGLVFAMAFKPLIFAIFLLSFPGILARRFRSIGLSPWLSLFVLLLIAADNRVLTYLGTSWTFAFSTGVLSIRRPDFLLEALALLVVLCILPSREGRVRLQSLGWPAKLALVLAALTALLAGLRAIDSLPELTLVFMPVLVPLWRVLFWSPVVLLALPPVALFALWPRAGERIDTTPRPPGRPLPIIPLVLVALGLTIAVLLVGSSQFGGPTSLIFMFVPLGLPNFALYFALVLALYLLIRRPSWGAVALAVGVALVFGSWVYGHVMAATAHDADARDVATVPKAQLVARPRVALVAESGNGTFRNLLLARGDIDAVLYAERNGSFTEYRRAPDGSRRWIEAKITALPASYFDLRVSEASRFRQDRTRYEMESPYELRLVDNGEDALVALWYQRAVRPPLALPVLSLNGWMVQNVTTTTDIRDQQKQFLLDALGDAPPLPVVKSTDKLPSGKKRKTLMDMLYGPDAGASSAPASAL